MTTINNQLTANVTSVVDTLKAIAEGEETYAKVNPDYDSDLSPEGHWFDHALEFYFTGTRNTAYGHWRTTGAVIVLTTGGPHIEVQWRGGEDFVVNGCWGSETVREHVACPPLEDLLRNWID